MAKHNYWCLNPECENRSLITLDISEEDRWLATCPDCGQILHLVGRPSCGVKPDYSGIENFGKPQYADARRRQCGMSGDVPPDTFHKDDIQ